MPCPSRYRSRRAPFALAALIALASCGDVPSAGCKEEGATELCRCDDGRSGARTCEAGGAWSSCRCAAPDPGPVDCETGAWGEWGACSATCGDGTQVRDRSVLVEPARGGAACPALSERRACNDGPCPVDCELSDWSAWTDCSAACGGGTRTRSRAVVTEPASGGAACGDLTETAACNVAPCPSRREEPRASWASTAEVRATCSVPVTASWASTSAGRDRTRR